MKRDLLVTLAGFVIASGAFVVAVSLIGSFILLEWWTPLSTIGGRAMTMWLGFATAVAIFINRKIP